MKDEVAAILTTLALAALLALVIGAIGSSCNHSMQYESRMKCIIATKNPALCPVP